MTLTVEKTVENNMRVDDSNFQNTQVAFIPNSEADKIRLEIEKIISNPINNLNQTTLAKKIGYSNAALNTFLKGSYKGNLEEFIEVLKKFLKAFNENKNRLKTVLNFCETSVSKNIFSIASMCKYNGEIGVCFGSSGLGKTTAIKEFQRINNNVIVVDPDEKASARALLKQIGTQLKLPNFSQQMEQFTSDIVKKLYGTGCLIIVDEAENLDSQMFRLLRKIHDRCDNTCSVLFVGTEVLYGNLLKLQGEFNYVVNRIACCAKLDYLKDSDIKKLVQQVFPDAEEDILQVFIQETNRNARVLYNTLKRAKDITQSGQKLSAEVIKTARGFLLVGREFVKGTK